jgi:hypothetical protein
MAMMSTSPALSLVTNTRLSLTCLHTDLSFLPFLSSDILTTHFNDCQFPSFPSLLLHSEVEPA